MTGNPHVCVCVFLVAAAFMCFTSLTLGYVSLDPGLFLRLISLAACSLSLYCFSLFVRLTVGKGWFNIVSAVQVYLFR